MSDQQPNPAADPVHTTLQQQLAELESSMKATIQGLRDELAQTKTALSEAIEQAKGAAATAQATANDGVRRANNAQTKADDGVRRANNAQTKADDGVRRANNAQTKADDGVRRANNAQTTANNVRLSVSGVYTWHQGQHAVRMLPAKDTLACLTKVTGKFEGGGEAVQLFVHDGHWHLGGGSAQIDVAAEAICVTVTRS